MEWPQSFGHAFVPYRVAAVVNRPAGELKNVSQVFRTAVLIPFQSFAGRGDAGDFYSRDLTEVPSSRPIAVAGSIFSRSATNARLASAITSFRLGFAARIGQSVSASRWSV